MKKETITNILNGVAAFLFMMYLCTKKSEFMFFGGLFLIAASIMLIITNKEKN